MSALIYGGGRIMIWGIASPTPQDEERLSELTGRWMDISPTVAKLESLKKIFTLKSLYVQS